VDDTDKLKSDSRYKMIFELSRNITRTGKTFCAYLVEWIESDAYKRHWDEDRQKWHECQTFAEFMEASPARGLGLDVQKAVEELRILSAGKVKDAETVLARWTGELGERALNKNGDVGKGRPNSFDNIKANPGGTSTDYTLRRLARDGQKDLLRAIEKHELSVNQAAIQAGYRKKKSPAELALANFRKTDGKLEVIFHMLNELDGHEKSCIRERLEFDGY
jgi:hypothetical protein